MELGKMETIKLKGKIYTLRTANKKDGREFVELENCIKIFFNMEEKEMKQMIKQVPKSYIKNVAINDEQIKFIDRMALGILLNHHRNYEFFQWYTCRHVSSFNSYSVELFRKSTTHLLEKSGQVKNLKDKIKKYDEIQQDMLHNAENNQLTDKEKMDFANQLITMRHERRVLKNQLAFDLVVKEFFDYHGITQKEVNDILKEMSRLEHIFDRKIYIERANTVEHEEVKKEIAQKMSTKKIEDKPIKKELTPKQQQAKLTRMMKKARIK